MALITIEFDTAVESFSDVIKAFTPAVTLGLTPMGYAIADMDEDERPQVSATEDAEAPKRTRRTKAQIAADEAAAKSPGGAQSEVTSSVTLPADPFADGHPNNDVNLDSIKAMVQQAMEKIGALATQNLIKEHGAGAGRPSEIKPEHYAAVHAALAQVI